MTDPQLLFRDVFAPGADTSTIELGPASAMQASTYTLSAMPSPPTIRLITAHPTWTFFPFCSSPVSAALSSDGCILLIARLPMSSYAFTTMLIPAALLVLGDLLAIRWSDRVVSPQPAPEAPEISLVVSSVRHTCTRL